MKSLRYILNNEPKNLDDCLDLSKKNDVKEISLELKTSRDVNEETGWIRINLYSELIWNFTNKKVQFEQCFESYLIQSKKKTQQNSIEKANKQLKEYVQNLNSMGFKVTYKKNNQYEQL